MRCKFKSASRSSPMGTTKLTEYPVVCIDCLRSSDMIFNKIGGDCQKFLQNIRYDALISRDRNIDKWHLYVHMNGDRESTAVESCMSKIR